MQKLIFLFMILINNGINPASHPPFNQPYGTEQDYKRLWYLNIQYIQAWVQSDTATYDKLLWAEDFVHQSGENGGLYPKKDIMSIFGEERFKGIEYFYADSTRIQFISDSVAMILSRPPYCAKNSQSESRTQYNDVYVKRNGHWICVSANITAVTNAFTPLPVLKGVPQPTKFVTLINANDEDIAEITRLHGLVKEMFEGARYNEAKGLLDDQFIYLGKDGSLFTRNQLTYNFRKKAKQELLPYTLENVYIRFVATDVAMVHGATIYRSPDNELTGVQFNDIFVKRRGTWKCVSSNNTPIKN